MRATLNLFYSAALILLTLGVVSAQPTRALDAWERAEAAYRDQDYERAAALYDSLAQIDPHQALAWYNLGNCHYRLKNIGAAVWSYRKAQILRPSDPDMAHNLQRARALAVDQLVPVRQGWLERQLRWLFERLGPVEYAGLWGLGSLFLGLGMGFWGWDRKRTGRRFFALGAVLSALLGMVALIDRSWTAANRTGVMIAARTDVRTEPAPDAPIGFVLHEGTEFRLVDRTDTWWALRLEDGKVGWIPRTAAQLL